MKDRREVNQKGMTITIECNSPEQARTLAPAFAELLFRLPPGRIVGKATGGKPWSEPSSSS